MSEESKRDTCLRYAMQVSNGQEAAIIVNAAEAFHEYLFGGESPKKPAAKKAKK